MKQYSWNPVFNLIIKIKSEYKEKFGKVDSCSFEKWLTELDVKEYTDIFSHLKVNQHNNLILIRYVMAEMHESMWTDPESIYRECRSVVSDIANEKLVLTPFRKFFNLNEVEENNLENVLNEIAHAKTVEITDKMDGSMQNARYYDGRIIMSGSRALDANNSWRLEDGYGKLTLNHKQMITDNPDFTFIFEYISLRDAHVVKYSPRQEGMYLVGMRNVFTGKQLSYKDIQAYASRYEVPMTKVENRSFEDILRDAKTLKSDDKEGWVINIDGHMIKLKCDDYVQLHKVIDGFSSVNTIIKSIADDTFDDLISKVPLNYKEKIIQTANSIYEYMRITKEKIEEYYEKAPKKDRKEYMIWVNNNCPKDIQGYLRQKYLNAEYHILKTSYASSTKYKKMNEIGMGHEQFNLLEDIEEEK
jgi:T4 RnlA family RNA ligase